MSHFIKTNPNNTIVLTYQTEDRDDTIYVRASIYNSTSTLVTTKDLSLVADGMYTNTWSSASDNESFFVVYIPYTDSGYTTEDTTHGSDVDYITIENAPSTGIFRDAASKGIKEGIRKELTDIPEKVWNYDITKAKGDKAAGKELRGKSEFDPIRDPILIPNDLLKKSDLMLAEQNILNALPEGAKDYSDILSKITQVLEAISNKKGLSKNDVLSKEDVEQEISKLMPLINDSKNIEDLRNNVLNVHESVKAVFNRNDRIDEVIKTIGDTDSSKTIIKAISTLDKFEDITTQIKKSDKNKDIIDVLKEVKKQTTINEQLVEALNQEEAKRLVEGLTEIGKILKLLGDNQKTIQIDVKKLKDIIKELKDNDL